MINPPLRLTRLIQEQHSICSRLLHHLRVHIVSIRPCVLVGVVCVHYRAREVGLLVCALAGELVEGEGCW